jgi:hypothetical protein
VKTVERDSTTVQSKPARAAKAIREARESLNTAARETCDPGATSRDIDQFTARVLAII